MKKKLDQCRGRTRELLHRSQLPSPLVYHTNRWLQKKLTIYTRFFITKTVFLIFLCSPVFSLQRNFTIVNKIPLSTCMYMKISRKITSFCFDSMYDTFMSDKKKDSNAEEFPNSELDRRFAQVDQRSSLGKPDRQFMVREPSWRSKSLPN